MQCAQPEPEPVARNYCREIYEVWAGSEGIPMPETAPEAYLLHLVEQMRDIAKEGLRAPPQREWQGLTDEEMLEAYGFKTVAAVPDFILSEAKKELLSGLRAIEAKLREKNSD